MATTFGSVSEYSFAKDTWNTSYNQYQTDWYANPANASLDLWSSQGISDLFAANTALENKSALSYVTVPDYANSYIALYSSPGSTAAPGMGLTPPGAGSYASCGTYTYTPYDNARCTQSDGNLLATLFDGSKYSGPVSGLAFQSDKFGNNWAVTKNNLLPLGEGFKMSNLNGFVVNNGLGGLTGTAPPSFFGSGLNFNSIASSFGAGSIVSALILVAVSFALVFFVLRFSRVLLRLVRS